MATITPTQARFLGNIFGTTVSRGGVDDPAIIEKASQSYAVGAPVELDATLGTVVAIADSQTTIPKIAGMARKAATGVTGDPAYYRAIVAGDRFVMNIRTGVLAVTDIGTVATLSTLTSGILVCEVGGTVDDDKPKVVIEKLYTVANGFSDGDAVGDTTGRVVVRVVDTSGLQG